MTPSNPPIAARRQLEPTHPCIRCGREGVPMDAGLCELCNPLELSQPSATQMHGIAAVGIIAFIAVLAVAGRFGVGETGPFAGSVTGVVPTASGLEVTLAITNQGSGDAAISCGIRELKPQIGSTPHVVQIPLIKAGATLTWTTTVTKFGKEPVPLAATCPP